METTSGSWAAASDEVRRRRRRSRRGGGADVAVAQLVEDVRRFAAGAQLAGHEGGELEVGPGRVGVDHACAREVDGAFGAIDLGLGKLEVDAEALDDFGIGGALDFEADGVAFAAVVELYADGFEEVAGFLFLKVEIAVAGDAEGGLGEDLVAAVHAGGVALDEVLEEDDSGWCWLPRAGARGAAARGGR